MHQLILTCAWSSLLTLPPLLLSIVTIKQCHICHRHHRPHCPTASLTCHRLTVFHPAVKSLCKLPLPMLIHSCCCCPCCRCHRQTLSSNAAIKQHRHMPSSPAASLPHHCLTVVRRCLRHMPSNAATAIKCPHHHHN
jgi:hypothetical protein